MGLTFKYIEIEHVRMYMHVSCTPSDKCLAALERRMFLCDGLSPAVSDSHLLEACVTILR